MPNSWREAYSGLREYIAGNPKVEIGKSVIAIPADVRPEFYRLFDTVRVAFLKERFPVLLDEAETLSKGYKEVRDEVAKLLGLTDTEMAASLNWFLQEPTNGLARVLFNLLFDLLKGKIDAAIFEQVASRSIESSSRDFYRSGYEKWVTLSLVKLLACDKAFTVPIRDVTMETSILEGDVLPGGREEPVPDPEETERLSLGRGMQDSAAFIVPNFIAHSTKIERYVAIRVELTDAIWTAKVVSEAREWYPVGSVKKEYGSVGIWPDLVIHVGDRPEDLALIADSRRISRPDLIIECMEQKDWYQQEGLERVRLHHDVLKPGMGTYIVSREPVPEQAYKELEPASGGAAAEPATGQKQETASVEEPEKQAVDIHILTVGFDQSRLEPIIAALSPVEVNTGEPLGQ